MRLREILRFELRYQIRRVQTWLYFAVVLVVASLLTRNGIADARNGGPPLLANSPHGIAVTTVLCNLLWVLIAAPVAGSAAARDVQTRMHPLIYTTPVSKADYLGGRFLAAFVLHALILLMVPVAILLALFVPGVEPEILGPFRASVYLSAYGFLTLPTVLAVTAIQFSRAALSHRVAASYVGSVIFLACFPGSGVVTNLLHMPTIGRLLDPIGLFVLSAASTPIEQNTLLVGTQGVILANRIVWIGIALSVLVFTFLRFRLADSAAGTEARRASKGARRGSRNTSPVSAENAGGISSSAAGVRDTARDMDRRTFGFATHLRQMFAIASMSFGAIARSAIGLVLWLAVAILIVLFMPLLMELTGVSLVPRTADVLSLLTAAVTGNQRLPWALIPLLIVYYAGELVWRERDARLSEIADTTPVPEWVLFLGKFFGLGLVLTSWMALLGTAGVLGQARLGYFHFELGLYLRILFGIQLVEYLLFAVLTFAVHALVNQKQIGYLVTLIAYGFLAFAPRLGIEHNLLVYASSPGWTYSDMRGFGGSLGPWAWFTLYWAACALLLAVATTLVWVRGSERGLGARLYSARLRCTRSTVCVAAAAAALMLSVGGFIFYNTNVLHAYVTDADRMTRGAEYERRYGQYFGIPQPRLTATTLRVEIYPERRQATVNGTYSLVNDSGVAIESIHLATAPAVRTVAVSFNRPVARAVEDEALNYRIYTLAQPLSPGETLRLTFEVDYAARGFTNDGADASIVANGTSFTNGEWLPAIGYQSDRELRAAGVRKQYGLAPPRPEPSFDDPHARRIRVGGELIAFDAIVGTSESQIAVAPGTLRRTWTDAGRRYFEYATDVPINNEYGVFSAQYAVHEDQWTPHPEPGRGVHSERAVAIYILHHPGHPEPVERMVTSVRASLDRYTREFGPYPYPYLRLIETPGRSIGVQTEAATIQYGEGFSLLKRGSRPQDVDPVFAVIAHGVARGWWGMQVVPAAVEGSGLLNTSLETYCAMRVIEDTFGLEQLRVYVRGISREHDFLGVRTRSAPSLLRATDAFSSSRGAPFALYAVREYIGTEKVDEALRHLFEKHRSAIATFDSRDRELAEDRPLATSMDLYRELQAVTPASLQSLLHDLFEVNTYWELETKQATAVQTDGGTWKMMLDVQARKMVVGETGIETEVPMDDWIEVGVVDEGKPYLEKQRIRSGRQTIVLTVPQKPARAGIDPRHLLSDLGEIDDNVADVKTGD